MSDEAPKLRRWYPVARPGVLGIAMSQADDGRYTLMGDVQALFTRADVSALRDAAGEWETKGKDHPVYLDLHRIANKIESLLPPNA